MFGHQYTDTFKYDREERLSEIKSVSKITGYRTESYYYFFYDKYNRMSKCKTVYQNYSDVTEFSYNKSNQIVKSKRKASNSTNIYASKYKYNKKGLMVQWDSIKEKYDKYNNVCSYDIRNIYDKHKLLKKRQGIKSNSGLSMNFRYKKIKVEKKYLNQVKKQQWALLNEGYNFVFGMKYQCIEMGWS